MTSENFQSFLMNGPGDMALDSWNSIKIFFIQKLYGKEITGT